MATTTYTTDVGRVVQLDRAEVRVGEDWTIRLEISPAATYPRYAVVVADNPETTPEDARLTAWTTTAELSFAKPALDALGLSGEYVVYLWGAPVESRYELLGEGRLVRRPSVAPFGEPPEVSDPDPDPDPEPDPEPEYLGTLYAGRTYYIIAPEYAA